MGWNFTWASTISLRWRCCNIKIADLFGGAGLAALGLIQAGHDVVSFEMDPRKHALAQILLGEDKCVLADVTTLDFSFFDAIWASPPCSGRSGLNHSSATTDPYGKDLVDWCLTLPNLTWLENVMATDGIKTHAGRWWNAAQFTSIPLQSRNRMIGGSYLFPLVYRSYKRTYGPSVCPCIDTKCGNESRVRDYGPNAATFYGRALTVDEAAYHMGLTIPEGWRSFPKTLLFNALGKGVPVYMARGFGEAYK